MARRLLSGPGSPMASPDFRWLVSGATISALGNAMTPVALAFAVLELGGSASELGMVVAAFAAAEVVTLLYGGVLGDRLPRQLLMQGSSAATALSQAVCAAVLVTGNGEIWMLMTIGLVNGCLGALSQPASASLTRFTVTAVQLADAIVVRRLCQQVALVSGYAIAGMVVAAFGPGWAIAVDAASFAIAAACYAMIRVAAPAPRSGSTLLADLGEGAREVLRHSWLALLIGQALVYHLFYGGVQGVLGPIVVSEEWNEAAWGWALAALMSGFILGGLVSLRWRPAHLVRVGVVMLSLTAAFPLAMAATDQLWLLLLGAAVHGFGLEIFDVNWELAIQQNVAEDKLARVFSFDMVGSFVCRPLGLALTGPIAAVTGNGEWILVVAAVMAGSSLLSLGAPSVRRLRRQQVVVAETGVVVAG
ncbi:MAG TPA: MFS transporter [Nocardioides sp.]|nr:MFS transporter [Nocardioides sp.]